MHSCALTMAMLCGPKLVLVSYRPVAGFLCRGQASRQAAGVIGTNQRRKSDRAQQKRGRRGDDGARRVRRVGQGPGRPVIIRRRVGGVENGASKTFVCAC